MEKYELVRDIGSGNFGVARLMRNKETKELVAMKYIPRGQKVIDFRRVVSFCSRDLRLDDGCYRLCSWFFLAQIDENVAREIINHRSLRHPNIIRFKEVGDSKQRALLWHLIRVSFDSFLKGTLED